MKRIIDELKKRLELKKEDAINYLKRYQELDADILELTAAIKKLEEK